jgi:hypothetical protein
MAPRRRESPRHGECSVQGCPLEEARWLRTNRVTGLPGQSLTGVVFGKRPTMRLPERTRPTPA